MMEAYLVSETLSFQPEKKDQGKYASILISLTETSVTNFRLSFFPDDLQPVPKPSLGLLITVTVLPHCLPQ
jgi:hypothetical protein